MSAGLKLLGVYFAVSGLAGVGNILQVITERAGFLTLVPPAVFLTAGFLLIKKTSLCQKWCDGSPPAGNR